VKATEISSPRDRPALAAALVRVLTDEPLRRRLGDGGRCFARGFTWERTADLAFEAVRSVLARAAGRGGH
jgi:glycosyltransferase involved in cell wall biosynthesis